MTKKIFIAVLVTVLIVVIYVKTRKKEDGEDDFKGDFEGDNYQGSKYYVGDKDFYENDKGRAIAHAVPSSLYKVVEPAYKLKYEFNDKGKKTLIRVSHDDKPDLKKGSQLRVIKASEESPLKVHGHQFVQTIYGNFVKFDKIKKVRD
jgi:hypothetical protein